MIYNYIYVVHDIKAIVLLGIERKFYILKNDLFRKFINKDYIIKRIILVHY
jgi:hypothetical protein